MSLLGNALIGAIGGGAQSYADQIRLEAQQAREDRLKLKERSYQTERDAKLFENQKENALRTTLMNMALEKQRATIRDESTRKELEMREKIEKRNRDKWVSGVDDLGHYQQSNNTGKREYIIGKGGKGSDKLDPKDELKKEALFKQLDVWSKVREDSMDADERAKALTRLDEIDQQINELAQTGVPEIDDGAMKAMFDDAVKRNPDGDPKALADMMSKKYGADFSRFITSKTDGAKTGSDTVRRKSPDDLPTATGGDYFARMGVNLDGMNSRELAGERDSLQGRIDDWRSQIQSEKAQNELFGEPLVKTPGLLEQVGSGEKAVGEIERLIQAARERQKIPNLRKALSEWERIKRERLQTGYKAKASEAEANIQKLKAMLSEIEGQ